MIGGDPDIDTYTYENVNNPKSRDEMLDIISHLNHFDIWRDYNTELKNNLQGEEAHC